MACAVFQSDTVSKNPVAVPAQLYATPIEAQETTETAQQSSSSSLPDAALMKQLQAVDDELNAGEYETAQQQLTQLTPLLKTNPTLQTNLIILQTKLALLAGNPARAVSWLNQLSPELYLNASQQHYVMQLRIQALYRTNQILLSAIANIEDNSDTTIIWDELLTIDPDTLQAQQTAHSQPVITGWLQLAQIAQRNANNFNALKNNLTEWQKNHPQHPAISLLSTMNNVTQDKNNTSAIAVILPLSGGYASLGQKVQKGVLAAHYASTNTLKQRVTFYDSNAESIAAIYQRIQANGDALILGPLTKEDTEELLNIAQETPKIISLNYTSINSPNSHLEFGLSPEDEAKQTAQLAWRQGKSQAIIIAPKTEKGEQTANAFIETWRTLGGQVVDQYNYANNDNFSKSISTLLGVTDSKWRQHLVHSALQLRIASTPYFRKDADMVFLIADPQIARQIGPFIKFYSGNYFSVFATSSVYESANNPNVNKDLNDIYFCDMPAILKKTRGEHERLYFLGADAYLLAMQQPHLNTLPRFPIIGATGKLTIDATHDIQRELLCAQFKNGHPIPL